MRPRLDDELEGFLVISAITLLILNRRERPSEDFGLARLVAATDAEFEATAADDIEHRGLLGDSNRMPPRHDVCSLAEPNLFRARGDRGLRQNRIRTELRAFGLKVMLGHKKIIEDEFVGEHALADLT